LVYQPPYDLPKPSVFVGSSSEGLEFARAIRSLLTDDAEVTLWKEGFFEIGKTFIETLLDALPRFDYAILILTATLVTASSARVLSSVTINPYAVIGTYKSFAHFKVFSAHWRV
jgi:hypothetical protein